MSKITDPALLKQLNEESAGDVPQTTPSSDRMQWGNEVDILHGVMQGWLDPIEGLTQLAEKSTGWHLAPEGLKNWARDYRKRAQSTYLGQAGEVAGNIVGPVNLIPGGGAVRGGNWALRGLEGLAAGAATPVSGGGDYWKTKAGQAIGGAVGGSTLPGLAQAAGRLAPAVARRATNIPAWLWQHSGIPQAVSSAAQQTAGRLTPRQVGRVYGQERGQRPTERLYITPGDRPQPSEKPAPSQPPQPSGQSFQDRFSGDDDGE